MMNIDEAIAHAMEVAERQEYLSTQDHGYCEKKWNVKAREKCAKCAADHRQLAEWLKELKEARRLLKMAVEDIHDVLSSQIKITNYTLCEKCKHYLNCNCKDKCMVRYNLKQWRYADKALKLIGDESNK